VAGFRRWQAALAWLAPLQAAYSTEQGSVNSARMIARMEQSTANHLFFRANCLERSLTLCWLLHRRGIAAELCIGARKDAGRFEAHAWVESSGVVLNDTSTRHLHFVPFDGPVSAMETQAP
jgi:Transglutaminase-like superfamily